MKRMGLSTVDAEDLVQEAWTRWCSSQPVKVEHWLRTTIRNLAIDAARRRAGTRPGDPMDLDFMSLEALPTDD